MRLLPARIVVAAVISVFLCTGCDGRGGTALSPNAPTSVAAAFETLGIREAEHHRTSLASANGTGLRSETGRYAADMASLMDAMMDSCLAMGSRGMMGDHDMRRMGDATGAMGERIRDHHARIDSLATLDEMRYECVEHHDEMLNLLEEMPETLPQRGMMGGGMRGGERMSN